MTRRRLVSLLLGRDATRSRAGATDAAAVVHAASVKAGHDADARLSNHLLSAYGTAGFLASARRVFDGMPRRSLVAWSALISCHVQAGRPDLALALFARMDMDARPNEYVYGSVLRSCGALRTLAVGVQVHADAVKNGFLGVSFVANSVISMYMKCRCFEDGYAAFKSLVEPNVVSYNAAISGLAESSQPQRGLEVFKLMKLQGLHPDRFSYAGVLGICIPLALRCTGELLHGEAIKIGLDIAVFVGNVILDMYSKIGTITDAEKVFRCMEEKDVITWNTHIAAYSRHGVHIGALMVFKDMVDIDHDTTVLPDDHTLSSALAACAELSFIRHGEQVHGHLIRSRKDPDVAVGNAIIDMYAKCGKMVLAARVFDRLPSQILLSWNTMISGFGKQGNASEAIKMFDRMKEAGIVPDSVTFTALIAACNHAGWVNKGMEFFNCMRETYRISPRIEHVSCIADLLGRAGMLQEAEQYFRSSELRHDPVALGSLLSASRVHGDAGTGERAARRLLALGPTTSSPYVLLSQLYASDKRWDNVAEARGILKNRLPKKDAAWSVI
ncbi:hypothetical protein GUJ93_ZPchr0006g42149 [Zizania palustris]|uniref:Pentatricopeptide repeat-containing protein n=1 Tax=Zizania palustris TaxID=103762 RepID=A0A8J5STM2_ZIZPA|nr:hypothetical protein GUJ93_ZPchr0006g42149 [Zizania palustris]